MRRHKSSLIHLPPTLKSFADIRLHRFARNGFSRASKANTTRDRPTLTAFGTLLPKVYIDSRYRHAVAHPMIANATANPTVSQNILLATIAG
ncbi:hypothetical protein [Candidatus Methylomirabilis sp.]|uniref:hypothetical protein n=1 Tax=Candidatus Methylomirabilis sp. TaxID=2032687 RepID=UPI003C731FE7